MARTAPGPPQVPGYAEARSRGLLPRVATRPPEPLPGTPAGTLMARWTVVTIGGFAAFVTLGVVAGKAGVTAAAAWLAIAAGGSGFLVTLWWLLGRVGDRFVAEIGAGYTTLVLDEGTFWMASLRPWRNGAIRVRWDCSGTWVCDRRSGLPVATPDLTVLPPGSYPSPHRADRWELWSGRMWTGNFRSPPTAA